MSCGQFRIHPGEHLARIDAIRKMPELHGEAIPFQDVHHGAVVRPEGLDVRGVVDVHEVVGLRPQDFRREEKERPVAPDRPSERATVLVPAVWRLALIEPIPRRVEHLEMVARVECFVPEEEECATGEPVAAALRHDVDDAPGRLAELRGIRVGDDLELLHRLLAERGPHGANREVVVVETIHRDVVEARPLPGERKTRRRDRALVRRAVRVDAGGEHGEGNEVTAVGRQPVDLPLGDHGGHLHAARIEQGRRARHRHRLGGPANRQDEIDLDGFAKRQRYVARNLGDEAGAYAVTV